MENKVNHMVGSEYDDMESFPKTESGLDKVIVVNPSTPFKVTTPSEELEEMFQKVTVKGFKRSAIPEFPVKGFDFTEEFNRLTEPKNNKEEYLRFHKEVCDKLVEITRKKNSDYTGSNDNPFANFTSVENRGIASTEQGFLVRMNDKFERIISFVNTGTLEVKDESVSDTLSDLANYCILFMGYLNQKKNGNSN